MAQGQSSSSTCSTCHGGGMINGAAGTQRCPMCEGSGQNFDPGLFFVYELGPIVLGALGFVNYASLQILDRSFRWMLAAAVSTGPFTIQIYDSRNKRPFSQQQVHSANIFGTAQNPMPLLTPFTFMKRGSILASMTDLSNAQNTIRLSFIGVELNDAGDNQG